VRSSWKLCCLSVRKASDIKEIWYVIGHTAWFLLDASVMLLPFVVILGLLEK